MNLHYKKAFLALLFSFGLTTLSQAQVPEYQWTNHIGGSENQFANVVKADNEGNVYASGIFYGSIDADPGVGVTTLTSSGLGDVFLTKFDSNGDLIWAVSFGGSSTDYVYGIDVDDSNDVYLTGYYKGTSDFDPGVGVFNLSSSVASNDVYIQKINSEGGFEWAKSMGGSGTDYGRSISYDANGFLYTVGYFQNTADFDPNSGVVSMTSNGFFDMFIQKLKIDGEFVWAKSVGGPSNDFSYSGAVDPLGNFYFAGNFGATVDFDPGTGISNMTANGSNDIFIGKLNDTGDFVWARSMGGPSYDFPAELDVDPNGNVYITGEFEDSIDFDPGANEAFLVSNGGDDIFVQKLDSNGNFVWAKSVGGTGADRGKSIDLDENENVYIIGHFRDSVDFDPGAAEFNRTTNGSDDVFIQKLDSNGDFIWATSFGGSGSENGNGIDFNQNKIYTAGLFSNTVDFDPGVDVDNITALSSFDAFVQKFSQCDDINETDVINSCGSYTWIDGNTYSSSNNTATFTVTGATIDGCDSVYTLDLTIEALDVSVQVTGASVQANNTTATSYQWIDCQNGNSPIASAANSSFEPTVNGEYAVVISDGNCTDTSACVQINSVGIDEGILSTVMIYPNPANDYITVSGLPGSAKIDLVNALGQVLLSSKEESNATIDISNIATGVYSIVVSSEGNKLVRRIIVE